MIVTVTCSTTDAVYSLDVSPEIELENFRVLVGVESGMMDRSDMVFLLNGKILVGDKKNLTELGVVNNDVLLYEAIPRLPQVSNQLGGLLQGSSSPVRPMLGSNTARAPTSNTSSNIDWSSIQIPSSNAQPPLEVSTPVSRPPPSSDDPETIRQMFLNDLHQLSLLKERNPRMADAIHSAEDFRKVLEEQRQERAEQERERIRLLAADPFDLDAQAQIAEEIRMENVNLNMQNAMEYNPEAFAEVYMLYINCEVNGHPVKAFVDSGAQMTIMSKACAERCGVMRLVDHRWQGMAIGVGQQKIIGRVHLGQMQIGSVYLPTSFTILEQQPMDILLGLDMLKRHQCCIDLKKNVLFIGTTGIETKFLSESELPECARLNRKRCLPKENSAGGSATSNSLQEEEDGLLAEALLKSQRDATT